MSELRRVPIRENGEPLVDFLELCPVLTLDRPRFNYRRETMLRLGAAERLCEAAHRIPRGYRLAVVEGWRPPHIQRRMYLSAWDRWSKAHPDWSEVRLRRTVNRYTAPMNARVPPPHTTGGAMDLFLHDANGEPVDMHSPYKLRDPAGYALDAPGLSDTARRHRHIVRDALEAAGITNYPSEFWHYSYGDQGWAYRGGYEAALYGPIQPQEWSPDPADDTEELLTYLLNDPASE